MENWAHRKNHPTMPKRLLLCPCLRAKFYKKIINSKLSNAFRKKWRIDVPLWPDGARKATPGSPGARPRALWERLGSIQEHPGSVRASLIVEEKWARVKNVIFFQTLLAKLENIWQMHGIGNSSRKKWRTAVPLWQDWAWRTPPGQPRERPVASRERPSGVKKSYSPWRNGRTQKIAKNN